MRIAEPRCGAGGGGLDGAIKLRPLQDPSRVPCLVEAAAGGGGKGGPKVTFAHPPWARAPAPGCGTWRKEEQSASLAHQACWSQLGLRQRPPVSELHATGRRTEAGPLAQHLEQDATCWWCFGGPGKDHWPPLKKKKSLLSLPVLFFFFFPQKSQSPYFQFSKTKGPVETRKETSLRPTFVLSYYTDNAGSL